MLVAAKLWKVTWPSIDSDIRQFLADCACSLNKQNCRLNKHWKPSILPPGAVAIDLFSYGGTTYLTILDLDSDFNALLPVASKVADEILQVFQSWRESLDRDIPAVLCDRAGEWAGLIEAGCNVVRTATYHPPSQRAVWRENTKKSRSSARCKTFRLTIWICHSSPGDLSKRKWKIFLFKLPAWMPAWIPIILI